MSLAYELAYTHVSVTSSMTS